MASFWERLIRLRNDYPVPYYSWNTNLLTHGFALDQNEDRLNITLAYRSLFGITNTLLLFAKTSDSLIGHFEPSIEIHARSEDTRASAEIEMLSVVSIGEVFDPRSHHG